MTSEKIKRSLIAHFINTSDSDDDVVWSRAGINVTDMSIDYGAQTETSQDVVSDSATTDITAYQVTSAISQQCTKGDPVYDYVNKLRRLRSLLEEAHTQGLNVDLWDMRIFFLIKLANGRGLIYYNDKDFSTTAQTMSGDGEKVYLFYWDVGSNYLKRVLTDGTVASTFFPVTYSTEDIPVYTSAKPFNDTLMAGNVLECAITGAYRAEKQDVAVQIDTYGGAGGETPTLDYTLNFLGDPELGLFRTNKISYTSDRAEEIKNISTNNIVSIITSSSPSFEFSKGDYILDFNIVDEDTLPNNGAVLPPEDEETEEEPPEEEPTEE